MVRLHWPKGNINMKKVQMLNSCPTLEKVRPLNKKGKGQQFESVISKFAKGKITLA